MSVWFAIPSARAAAEAEPRLAKWRDKGYLLAIWRDNVEPVTCDVELRGQYPGYYGSINRLAARILAMDSKAEWIVSGGDDMTPDPDHSPESIASECTAHFGGTLGVMQPTGDRWGHNGHIYSEHVAGSPWMGREWCERAYGGKGPMWEEYRHYYGDESLQVVAKKLGLFWQRRDLSQFHDHYLRANVKIVPSFHRNASERFREDGAIFERRKRAGFPGHELAGSESA